VFSAVRNAGVYTRDFEKIAVTVDLETKVAKIECLSNESKLRTL
jgi:hypothetical protein